MDGLGSLSEYGIIGERQEMTIDNFDDAQGREGERHGREKHGHSSSTKGLQAEHWAWTEPCSVCNN